MQPFPLYIQEVSNYLTQTHSAPFHFGIFATFDLKLRIYLETIARNDIAKLGGL